MRKALKCVFGVITGGVLGLFIGLVLKKKSETKLNTKIDKLKSYYNILNKWLQNKHNGKEIENYFYEKNINSIAIYGMGEIGNRLYSELEKSSINVLYGIDKAPGLTYSDLEVYSLDEKLEEVDAIVVTVSFMFEEVEGLLKNKICTQVLSLEDIVNYL